MQNRLAVTVRAFLSTKDQAKIASVCFLFYTYLKSFVEKMKEFQLYLAFELQVQSYSNQQIVDREGGGLRYL